jgi:hypothetical protein
MSGRRRNLAKIPRRNGGKVRTAIAQIFYPRGEVIHSHLALA